MKYLLMIITALAMIGTATANSPVADCCGGGRCCSGGWAARHQPGRYGPELISKRKRDQHEHHSRRRASAEGP